MPARAAPWSPRQARPQGAILAGVSIGETLAGARSRAGLSIADVSARTRIRENLVRAIERDDFAQCGGDFYARGHIRALAAVVGADAEALVRQYDAAHPPARPERLEDPPRRPAAGRHPGRAAGLAIAVAAMLAVIGFAADKLVTGAQQQPASSPVAGSQAPARATGPPASARPSAVPATTSAPAASSAAPLVSVAPVSAAAYGPGGTSDGDDPQGAPLALSGNPATPWHTSWYTTARFGNLQAGTGLLLDLGHARTVTGAAIRLGNIHGADFQLRAGTVPAHLATVASESGAGGLVRLRLSAPVRARYLLIWFTLLPPDGAGTYQADVSAVTATVTS